MVLPELPTYSFFFVIMLIIPAVPSGSYFAEGIAITSTFSINTASRTSRLDADFILPSIIILTDSFPLKLTSPSAPTVTDGKLLNTSSAVPLAAIGMSSTLYTFLSISS